MKKYQIIYADPPWQFKNYNDKKATNWVGTHYGCMTTKDIKLLPIKHIADNNCILFIWGTFPKLPDCLEVIESWGFVYKTLGFNWYKKNIKIDSMFFGMGYWTRSNSEYCLLATKGHPKRQSTGVFQIVEHPRIKHSQKPDIIRDKIVELMGDLPRIELFAREKTEGWDVWGNEVKSDIKLIRRK
ncbi:MAG TPA: adenine methyltransferase [Candidatus Dependentiae bacterium]|nr:adenine methyltransferase [Candidatus Dependentiae bacterium]